MATMTTTRLATTRVEYDDAMDVDDAGADRTTEEIIVAAYRRDADAVASALRQCSPATTADMSLSRAAAVKLLGEDVYLGSHSWSTQEDFPVMYFAGARSSRPRPGRARVSPARPHAQIAHTTAAVLCFFPRNFSFCRVISRHEPLDPARERASRRDARAPRRAVRRFASPTRRPTIFPRASRGIEVAPGCRARSRRAPDAKKAASEVRVHHAAPPTGIQLEGDILRVRDCPRAFSVWISPKTAKPFRFFFFVLALDFFFRSRRGDRAAATLIVRPGSAP
jgi:hypothetical protein